MKHLYVQASISLSLSPELDKKKVSLSFFTNWTLKSLSLKNIVTCYIMLFSSSFMVMTQCACLNLLTSPVKKKNTALTGSPCPAPDNRQSPWWSSQCLSGLCRTHTNHLTLWPKLVMIMRTIYLWQVYCVGAVSNRSTVWALFQSSV